MRDDLPSGTVSFMFTDVEGSTRLLHELGAERYAQALAEHRRVVREICSAEGVEVDTQGDAFFFAFPTAAGAVAAARAITDALADGQIRLRIGLHTGTPLVTDEGYVGDDVHFAARVAASAHGGQVVLSQATRALVDDLPLTDLGEHRLKDIGGAVSIYQLGGERFPLLKTISNTNLPRPVSSFVGRERELAEVLAKINGGARLLTLTGPGGSGKTRLAVEAATTLVPSYKAGVFWVGLASLREPSLVSETIAQTLGAREGLAEHIGEREMLLLLDNLEQVIEAAPELSSLLTACPSLSVLCTSRELLRVQGEVEFLVAPLASSEAVALFCERSGLEPSEEVAELCARLDDLPLAVELAAARTKALSPAQILDRLADRLDLTGGRDADERQQTLRATIAWSYDLLAEEEQRVFRSLAVFAGGCTVEPAEEVAEADLETLQSLVEKSLLRFTNVTNERYWMLETIREFALEKLERLGTRQPLTRRHADYFLMLAQDAEPFFEGSDETEWLDRLDHDYDNLRAGLSFFDGSPQQLRMACALWRFWLRRGLHREGARWLKRALTAGTDSSPGDEATALRALAVFARVEGDLESAQQFAAQSREAAEATGDRVAEMHAIGTLANIALMQREYTHAAAFMADVEMLAAELGDEHALAVTVGNRAYLAIQLADFEHALALARRALVLGREMGDRASVITAALNLGLAAHALAHHREARDALIEGLDLARASGHRSYLLDGITVAAAVVVENNPTTAAQLVAAAKRTQAELGIELDPAERELLEAVATRLHGQAGTHINGDALSTIDCVLDTAAERALEALAQLDNADEPDSVVR